jgi:hypothetical protein
MSQALLLDAGLNVEKEELLARAAELEAPIPGLPTENPQAPSSLESATMAVEQLVLSANNMRDYLRAGDGARQRLADSLRDAAKAYEDVDEDTAQAIENETSIPTAAPVPTKEDVDPASLADTPMVAMGDLDQYADVIQNAWAIEKGGDQGASLTRFAEAWGAHQRSLSAAALRFRPFVHWEGDAARAAEASMDQHRQWLYQMAEMCRTMVIQARDIASAHRKAFDDHVSLPKGYLSSTPAVNEPWLRYDHERLVEMRNYYIAHPENITMRQQYNGAFVVFQQKSEEVVGEFARAATVPPMNPPLPPRSGRFNPPGLPDFPTGGPGNPYGDMPLGQLPAGMPSLQSGGAPATPNDAALGDALKNAKAGAPGRPTGPGVKPASFGGGLPSMPLRSLGDAESGSRTAGAAAAGAGGPKVPAAYAALGRGGGGGAGMPTGGAGAGQGQNNGKGKRPQQGDQALYTEDRAWTAGVIGNRQRQNAADKLADRRNES